MTVDINDLLIVTGVGMVLAGTWLAAGLPAALVAGGLFLLAAGLVRAANQARRV